MGTSTVEDLSQALKNIGSTDGVQLSVSLDKKTMNHFTALALITVTLGVGLVYLIKK